MIKYILLNCFLLLAIPGFAQNESSVKMPDGKTYPRLFINGIEHLIKDGDTTRLVRETMPEYPGGQRALQEYLSKNLKYPKTARKDKVQGVVNVGFNVNVDGKVDSVKIKEGVRKDLDDAALELIKGMPEWTPGTQDGKPVIVKFSIPLNFKL